MTRLAGRLDGRTLGWVHGKIDRFVPWRIITIWSWGGLAGVKQKTVFLLTATNLGHGGICYQQRGTRAILASHLRRLERWQFIMDYWLTWTHPSTGGGNVEGGEVECFGCG